MHTAHLLLIFYRVQISEDFELVARNIPGAFVYLLIFAMFVTSFDSTTRALGRKNWKRLHTVGLYVIFIAFAQREIPRSLETAESANWILTALAVAALLVRVTNKVLVDRSKAQLREP
jgi:DMSO/TMAO reductase YedYZ heme-binding membrane subunit